MRAIVAGIAVLCLVACGVPRDPEGTLERVTDGQMRVGAIGEEPWVILGGDGDKVAGGVEVELAERFARSVGAEIRWVVGSEQELMTALEGGDLDLVLGGLVATNPWVSTVTLTRPYRTAADGEEHVVAVRHGENAWLSAIERFLDAERAAATDRETP